MSDKIFVTKPSLASINEYSSILESIWENGILTHNGPVVQNFEKKVAEQLNLPNMVAVSNGTIALQMAIKALGIKGEIITSPFSWIATVSAIMWENCTPVFADIDPETLNIDPKQIEKKITDKTVAIMPVHVFGNPCDVNEIDIIAKKYNLKVIYDAAHSVGSEYNNKSLLEAGDISATSFHATKILNTAEGGGLVSQDNELFEKFKRLRFFGFNDQKDIVEEGFNGKMTEIHAALGIANLKYFNQVLNDRREKHNYYLKKLSVCNSLKFQKVNYNESNCSYFSVIFESEEVLLKINKILEENLIFARRYFYPSLNTYNNILPKTDSPISEDISRRILCLPLYFDLKQKKLEEIINLILENL